MASWRSPVVGHFEISRARSSTRVQTWSLWKCTASTVLPEAKALWKRTASDMPPRAARSQGLGGSAQLQTCHPVPREAMVLWKCTASDMPPQAARSHGLVEAHSFSHATPCRPKPRPWWKGMASAKPPRAARSHGLGGRAWLQPSHPVLPEAKVLVEAHSFSHATPCRPKPRSWWKRTASAMPPRAARSHGLVEAHSFRQATRRRAKPRSWWKDMASAMPPRAARSHGLGGRAWLQPCHPTPQKDGASAPVAPTPPRLHSPNQLRC